MRVTIGERLKGLKFAPAEKPKDEVHHGREITWEEYEASRVRPEGVLCLAGLPTSTYAPPQPTHRPDDGRPARVTGHMEFIHKTAPTLVIHGKNSISPEEYEAGRRR